MSGIDPASALSAQRRRRELDELGAVDVLVIGGGITGVGVALDAATRGLRVALVEARDLAFGTSRWSSKLVHGGLRYLASGAVGIAHESAVERGILMETIAPHLISPLRQMVPLLPQIDRKDAALTRAGFWAGDALRIAARTSVDTLARSRRVNATVAAAVAPTLQREGLRGGLINYDGQLVDDARLVVAVARTAAAHGASILTRCAASDVTGRGAVITDTLTGERREVTARVVINAAGVWSADVDRDVTLRPSRGTHLVFDARSFAGPGGTPLQVGLTVPVPGHFGRYVFALPEPDGLVYLGLTDEEAPEVTDVPTPDESEIDFLLDVINTAVQTPLRRDDIISTFAGLRPLLDSGGGETADVSRKHAVLVRGDGLVTVVGGKLTTYRRMAQDAVDAAVTSAGLIAGPCRTRSTPLVGAGNRHQLAKIAAPQRLIARYGTEAPAVAALAEQQPTLAAPIAAGTEVTGAELLFGILAEGAVDAADLVQRRTRLSFKPALADAAAAAAAAALEQAAALPGGPS